MFCTTHCCWVDMKMIRLLVLKEKNRTERRENNYFLFVCDLFPNQSQMVSVNKVEIKHRICMCVCVFSFVVFGSSARNTRLTSSYNVEAAREVMH